MSTIYLSTLVGMSEKELNKTAKQDIVSGITKYKYQWEHKDTEIEKLKAKLIQQSKNEHAAKQMLLAYTGYEIEKPEYGEPDIDTVDLLFLLGLAMAKAARY